MHLAAYVYLLSTFFMAIDSGKCYGCSIRKSFRLVFVYLGKLYMYISALLLID